MAERNYRSPLRDRQAQQTRELILDALTALLTEHAPSEVTTALVARGAGVSERTVYRHFPDRDALLRGLGDRIGHHASEDSMTVFADLGEVVVQLMAHLDAHPGPAIAEAVFNADPRGLGERTRERSRRFHHMVAAEFPDLDEDDHRRLTAVIRCLLSAQAWLRMREEFGVPGTESGPMVAWAIAALAHEIERGNPPPRPVDRAAHDDRRGVVNEGLGASVVEGP